LTVISFTAVQLQVEVERTQHEVSKQRAVSVEHRVVTDKHDYGINPASMASRRKKLLCGVLNNAIWWAIVNRGIALWGLL